MVNFFPCCPALAEILPQIIFDELHDRIVEERRFKPVHIIFTQDSPGNHGLHVA